MKPTNWISESLAKAWRAYQWAILLPITGKFTLEASSSKVRIDLFSKVKGMELVEVRIVDDANPILYRVAVKLPFIIRVLEFPWKALTHVIALIKTPAHNSPLMALKLFRWFVPRTQREEIDLAIDDLKEDVRDLRKANHRKGFIFTVTLWHTVRIIAAFTLDIVCSVLKRLLPIASLFVRRK